MEPETIAELEPEETAELESETIELASASDLAEPSVIDTLELTSASSEVEDGVPVAKMYLVLPVAVVVVSELYELV